MAAGNGTVNDAPVLNIDLASTISRARRDPAAIPQDGYSFAPFLHGQPSAGGSPSSSSTWARSKLNNGGPPPYIAVRTRRYLYVEYRRGWRELYDLRPDPWELRNVADEPPFAKTLASLHVLLRSLYTARMHRGAQT